MSEAALSHACRRALRIWGDATPGAADRARVALDILLGDLIRSSDSNAVMRSTLTMTGSPFEPAFSFAVPGLRYTVDAAPLEVQLHRRLAYVLSLLSRLQAPEPPAQIIRLLAPLQMLGGLRYGAQIGARHSESTDRYKLYIELPPEAEREADAFAEELLGSPPVLNVPDRDARPTIVGIDLTSGELEIYYRIENLHPLEIRTLLSRAQAVERAPEVMAMLAESQPLPIRHELPGATWGFSYARTNDDAITFSIYTFASTLLGPDKRARECVLSMGRRHGWDLTTYSRMSEPLVEYRGFLSHHSIFGLVVQTGRPPAAWVGLAPSELTA